MEGAVEVPVDRTGVEGQGSQVALAGDRFGKMSWNIACVRKVQGVPAQLGHNVLPEDDNLLGAILHSGWVAQELGTGDKSGKILGEMGGERWSWENRR